MRIHLYCCLLLTLGLAPALGQEAGPQATTFPESLLQGISKFNLAVLLQGDIRGNFGPCG